MKGGQGSLRVADRFRVTPWPPLATAAARYIVAMANKYLGAPHTPSLPANTTSIFSQGFPRATRRRGAGREASWWRRGTVSVGGGHGLAKMMLDV